MRSVCKMKRSAQFVQEYTKYLTENVQKKKNIKHAR